MDNNSIKENIRNIRKRNGLTQEETAARVGKSRPAVANALRLLKLPMFQSPFPLLIIAHTGRFGYQFL